MQSSIVCRESTTFKSASSNRFGAGTIVAIFLASLNCGNTPTERTGETQEALTTATTAMLVPAYIPSGMTSAWTWAMPTKTVTSYYVVTGPLDANGIPRPPLSPDPVLATHVSMLQSYGALVLGYVSWKTTFNRSSSDIKGDIDRWANNPVNLGIQLNGIFIDDAERSDESILPQVEWLGNYAQGLFGRCCYAPGILVFNWGGATPTMEKYVDCQLLKSAGNPYPYAAAMHWVTFEGDRYTYLFGTNWSDANHNWVHNLWAGHFANLIHDAYSNEVISGGPGLHIQTMSGYANAALLYATDASGSGDTWGQVADDTLWTNEQTTLPGNTQYNGFSGQPYGAEIFTYNVSQCPTPSL
jgi:hypothetical protein